MAEPEITRALEALLQKQDRTNELLQKILEELQREDDDDDDD
jgi:hypothetical protein